MQVFRDISRNLSLTQTTQREAVRRVRQYERTYDYPGQHIDATHYELATAASTPWGGLAIGLDGWLYPGDAQKLYELARFATGDILELGTGPGLSTYLLIQALLASGRDGMILTVDLNSKMIGRALGQLRGRPGLERVNFWCVKAVQALHELTRRQRRFGFVFVDDSHEYRDVHDECKALAAVTRPGAFVLIHDYCDIRNSDEFDKAYGVYQGARDGLQERYWEPWGVFGCAGLFRRLAGPGEISAGDA